MLVESVAGFGSKRRSFAAALSAKAENVRRQSQDKDFVRQKQKLLTALPPLRGSNVRNQARWQAAKLSVRRSRIMSAFAFACLTGAPGGLCRREPVSCELPWPWSCHGRVSKSLV